MSEQRPEPATPEPAGPPDRPDPVPANPRAPNLAALFAAANQHRDHGKRAEATH
jgi:hypothetical protein